MAACWYWCLLCSLAAWGNAAPLDAGMSQGETAGANAQEFSRDHPQLTDLTQGASDTGITSVDNKPLHVVQSNLQNSQPEAPQQGSDKAKKENHRGSQPGAIEPSKALEEIKKSQGDQIDTSGTSSLPKSKIKDLEQGEGLSVKSENIHSGLSAQGSSSKLNPVQSKTVQEGHSEDTNSIVKELKQSQDPSANDQNSQSGLSAQQPDTAKLNATKPIKAPADINKSENAQTDTSGTSSLPKSKSKESKQGVSIKDSNTQSGVSAQDSSKLSPVQAGNTQEKKDHPEESKTGVSHPGLNIKEQEQSLDLKTNGQNSQPVLSAQEPASGKIDSSEATNPHKDISDKSSIPESKTKELKQGEDPLIKDLNAQSGASAQGSSKLDLAQVKNQESKTEISDPDVSKLETNDKEMEDSLTKDQDLQSDLSVQQSQKLNPGESQKTEEEVVDSEDEQEKGLGDEKKKSAKHEEDSEGTPRNVSENSHFFAYLVTTAIIVAALYIAYHNKRKIIAFALEGKKSKIIRRPKSSDYQRLDQKI